MVAQAPRTATSVRNGNCRNRDCAIGKPSQTCTGCQRTNTPILSASRSALCAPRCPAGWNKPRNTASSNKDGMKKDTGRNSHTDTFGPLDENTASLPNIRETARVVTLKIASKPSISAQSRVFGTRTRRSRKAVIKRHSPETARPRRLPSADTSS